MTTAAARLLVMSLAALPIANGPSGPTPPCGAQPFPAYASLGAEPTIRHWGPKDVERGWAFPACVPWTSTGFASMVTIAGRFRHAGGTDGLVERVGHISKLRGIRYWSTSTGKWQTFIGDASALTTSDKATRRADFSVTEMRATSPVYFVQKDNTAGSVVYRLQLHEVSPNRVVVGIENVSTVKKFFKTILHPADAQTLYFFNRQSNDVWDAYVIMRISDDASSLATGNPKSAVNRALAYYRHFAGIPTDKDPPGAR